MTDFATQSLPADAAAGSPAGAPAADAGLRARAEEAIRLLLPRVLKQESDESIAPDAALVDDLGLTSGATLELILELEDHLDVQVDVETIEPDDLRSVTGLAAFIAAHVVDEG
ncbi:acyl carrier protein [Actinacidiphila acididurans]|uniref:Acyl carrier protein n=1 Tax=Actinacidiphila acididurans TaxID=2784346 RepID=A0ABS2U2N5_9ACTN|nr:acyl carrier protein [Actinacidiphila acididurans]MBM9509863.1 acyl carrier protein [Actinacidiphila acididurans]